MISFTSVTKAFGDDLIAIQDVSFNVEPGELIVITGPSGSGKTTLMRLLTKEYEPTEGEITFDNEPLSEVKNSKVHEHRRKIGVVFQDYKLLPELNVWENIALSLYIVGQKQTEIEERVTDLLRLISLDDKPFLFPSQLSGGEAQRVSIARALATAPAVIFADEPTGNLDAETSASIARLLQKINKLGTTILIATHDVSVLDLLQNERHIRLEKGHLVKDEKASGEAAPTKKVKTKETTPEPETKVEKKPPSHHEAEKPESKEKPEPPAEAATSEESAPKKKGLKLGWPFGKKKVDHSKLEDVEPKHAEDNQPIATKESSKTKIDDSDAKVEVENL